VNEDQYHYFVFVNPQYWLEQNPLIAHMAQQYALTLPNSNVRVILLTPDMSLPDPLPDCVVTLRFELPGFSELMGYLDGVLNGVDDPSILDIDDDGKRRVCFAGSGMSRQAFEMYTSLAIVEGLSKHQLESIDADTIIDGLNRGKTEIVNTNDLLELYPAENMEDVGGMENLKEWVAKRSKCYTDDAVEFGIEPPKGMIFVGPPGTGKSLASKAVARELGVPLVRLDFGRVFNSLVGKSEERMRTALRMVEAMAPCVLFCDEIDKGLAGMGGSGDSGTSSRVLGSFLTWLQENKTPVFSMVTANNVTGLPPELLRRGRFDATFSTGLPTDPEREEVFKIHLRKRGWKWTQFTATDRKGMLEASKGYVGAEIESAIKDGLIDAYDEGVDLNSKHILKALDDMVPLSKAFNEQIQAMTLWAKNNATPASRPPTAKSKAKLSVVGPRKTRTRPTKTEH
jgi:ATP-dependent 26S proteasome regulatory subunit